MKSLVTAIILFLSVVTLITVNYFVLDSLLEYTEEKLSIIPETLDELEIKSEEEKIEILSAIESTEKMWKKKEAYICFSLKHNAGREFSEQLIPAKSYFISEEYPEFLAVIQTAKDTLEHIRYDESIKIGNIM